MDRIGVDADAHRAGEVIVEPRARPGAMPSEDLFRRSVELTRRHPRPHPAAEVAQRRRDHGARSPQTLELVGVLDRHLRR
jgi:hypothetical protein